MKTYSEKISLNKNSRGCYILDTIKGCASCLSQYRNGCYGECYANKIANRYGFDFSKSIKRDFFTNDNQLFLFNFKDEYHLNEIIKQIKKSTMPFIRIGEMGDPSENWEHTIDVCKKISISNKPIVIITKHWKTLSDRNLLDISKLKICINTSISALDLDYQIERRLNQFYKLKNFCKSVLRIVSCDFNKKNKEGLEKSIIQKELFKHTPYIDTVFRCNKKNQFYLNDIIKIKKIKFLKSNQFASVFNKNTYLGFCNNCPDMCGLKGDDMLNSEEVCSCGHLKKNHILKEVYSTAMKNFIRADLCDIKKCKCHHFQSTTFQPQVKKFEVGIPEIKKSNEVQEEFGFVKK